MKVQHLILPVLAAAALGIGLPALAQQAGSDKADIPPKEVRVETTVKADGFPHVKIDGVPDEVLQKILKEALEFKGSEADFAKKSAAWKKEHGFTVTRKAAGHILITREGKEGSTRIEVMKGDGAGSASSDRRIEATRRAPGSDIRELKVIVPGREGAKEERRIELRSPKDLKPGEIKELELLKDLPLIMPFNFTEKDGVRIFRGEGRELTEKDRAAIRKEMQELRKKLRSLPKGEVRTFGFKEGKPLSEKELKEFTKRMEGLKELELSTIAPMAEGFGYTFMHQGQVIEGLSDADRKKMKEEMAKVHEEAKKKLEAITSKYRAKAKAGK